MPVYDGRTDHPPGDFHAVLPRWNANAEVPMGSLVAVTHTIRVVTWRTRGVVSHVEVKFCLQEVVVLM